MIQTCAGCHTLSADADRLGQCSNCGARAAACGECAATGVCLTCAECYDLPRNERATALSTTSGEDRT